VLDLYSLDTGSSYGNTCLPLAWTVLNVVTLVEFVHTGKDSYM